MKSFGQILDAAIAPFAPRAALRRSQARAAFEANASGPRNDSFYHANPTGRDISREAELMAKKGRDYSRNNSWAAQAVRVLTGNIVGWGVDPVLEDAGVRAKWVAWASEVVTFGDPELTFSGVQYLAARSLMDSGEMFLVRHLTSKGLRLSLHTSEEIDTSKDNTPLGKVSRIVNGIEYDAEQNRVRYFFKDPDDITTIAVRAEDVAHVFIPKWTRQNRGVSDFSAAAIRLKSFDELEDAQTKQQIVAACLGVFVTDKDGVGGSDQPTNDIPLELRPGGITRLPEGREVQVVNPPSAQGQDAFMKNSQRGIAAAFGVTYEDLTGDYSQSNFSNSRSARLMHWQWIRVLQYVVIEPMLLRKVFAWWAQTENIRGVKRPEWSFPVMPMINPEAEGPALRNQVRSGQLTPDEMVRSIGGDPHTHWPAYAANFKNLDALGIVLDSDPRKVTQMGQVQIDPAATAKAPAK